MSFLPTSYELYRGKRNQKMMAISHPVSNITRKAFGKRGLVNGEIVKNWPFITGRILAEISLPERITFPKGKQSNGTLHLRVENSAFSTELQHLQPLIIERINAYFGYSAIKNLRLIHGPLPKIIEKQSSPPRLISKEEKENISHDVEGISDPELRAALRRLGEAVMRKNIKDHF